MNVILSILGLIFFAIAVLALFRKKRGKNPYYIGYEDSEDTILIVALIRLWKKTPTWLLSAFFVALGFWCFYFSK